MTKRQKIAAYVDMNFAQIMPSFPVQALPQVSEEMQVGMDFAKRAIQVINKRLRPIIIDTIDGAFTEEEFDRFLALHNDPVMRRMDDLKPVFEQRTAPYLAELMTEVSNKLMGTLMDQRTGDGEQEDNGVPKPQFEGSRPPLLN